MDLAQTLSSLFYYLSIYKRRHCWIELHNLFRSNQSFVYFYRNFVNNFPIFGYKSEILSLWMSANSINGYLFCIFLYGCLGWFHFPQSIIIFVSNVTPVFWCLAKAHSTLSRNLAWGKGEQKDEKVIVYGLVINNRWA